MRLVASLTAAALLSGCAPSWPSPVTATSSAPRAIHSIDVLPLDLALWTEAEGDVDPGELRAATELHLMNTALASLASREYGVDAIIDWNGDYDGGHALPPDALDATLGALARYSAPPTPDGRLPVPYLPARLGTATGADATLYVGGWAYVAKHRKSTAHEVGRDALIVVGVVVAVVAVGLILAAISGKGSSHSSSSHSGSSHSGSSHESGPHAGGISGTDAPHPIPLVSIAQSRMHVDRGASGADHAAGAVRHVVDAFGRVALDIASHPDWELDPSLPHAGASKMFLEMTLVDNRTGLVLWHVHQAFPADAKSPADVERAARVLLASLPPA